MNDEPVTRLTMIFGVPLGLVARRQPSYIVYATEFELQSLREAGLVVDFSVKQISTTGLTNSKDSRGACYYIAILTEMAQDILTIEAL